MLRVDLICLSLNTLSWSQDWYRWAKEMWFRRKTVHSWVSCYTSVNFRLGVRAAFLQSLRNSIGQLCLRVVNTFLWRSGVVIRLQVARRGTGRISHLLRARVPPLLLGLCTLIVFNFLLYFADYFTFERHLLETCLTFIPRLVPSEAFDSYSLLCLLVFWIFEFDFNCSCLPCLVIRN